MSYVQRTPRLRLPDYITVKFIKLGEEFSTVAIFSRSRFGYGDLGLNETRTMQWLSTLKSFETDPSEIPGKTDTGDAEESASE